MECKKVQELLLTDFLDDEARQTMRDGVKAHLDACAGCRAFAETLRTKVSGPLRALGQVEPPAGVWQRIQQEIDEERHAEPVPFSFERLRQSFQSLFFERKPVYALAVSCAVCLIGLAVALGPVRQSLQVKDYLRQQALYMVSLNAPANGEKESDLNMGTAIEKYFF